MASAYECLCVGAAAFLDFASASKKKASGFAAADAARIIISDFDLSPKEVSV
jgi:hypothetical protein